MSNEDICVRCGVDYSIVLRGHVRVYYNINVYIWNSISPTHHPRHDAPHNDPSLIESWQNKRLVCSLPMSHAYEQLFIYCGWFKSTDKCDIFYPRVTLMHLSKRTKSSKVGNLPRGNVQDLPPPSDPCLVMALKGLNLGFSFRKKQIWNVIPQLFINETNMNADIIVIMRLIYIMADSGVCMKNIPRFDQYCSLSVPAQWYGRPLRGSFRADLSKTESVGSRTGSVGSRTGSVGSRTGSVGSRTGSMGSGTGSVGRDLPYAVPSQLRQHWIWIPIRFQFQDPELIVQLGRRDPEHFHNLICWFRFQFLSILRNTTELTRHLPPMTPLDGDIRGWAVDLQHLPCEGLQRSFEGLVWVTERILLCWV